jgi:hypothetical protein
LGFLEGKEQEMAKRLTLFLAVASLVLFTAGTIWGARVVPKKITPLSLPRGDELPDYLIQNASGVFWDAFCGEDTILSPYDTVIGCTYYDLQKDGSMRRMIGLDYQNIAAGGHGLHFTFMEGTGAPPATRYVDYTYWDADSGWKSLPAKRITPNEAIAGYTGLDVFRPLAGYFKPPSRAVVCHHWTTALSGDPSEMHVVLAIEPNKPGEIAMDGGSYWYDIPDLIHEPGVDGVNPAYWPDCGIDSLNRIHVVACEQEPETGAIMDFGYVRCEEIPPAGSGDSLMCCAPGEGCWRLAKETYYTDQNWHMSTFGRDGVESQLVACSKVSNKVALVWTNLAESEPDSDVSQLSNDIMYVESTNGGDDWFQAGAMPPPINITKYDSSDLIRAYADVAAIYDMDDSLHIFWNTHGYNMAEGTYDPNDITLWHWSKATERICDGETLAANEVAHAEWEAEGGAWHWLICSMLAGVGYDPELFNYNYIYLQWVQFDTGKASQAGYTQGDIYMSVSTDAGLTWQTPVNVTNSTVPDCQTGECASDHWPSMAERVDSFVYMQWIYDLDAGGMPQDEGGPTDNPVIFYRFPVDSIPILNEARISWSPDCYTDPPIHIPIGGADTVYLTIENVGIKTLNITNISTSTSWLNVNLTSATLPAGGCPVNVSLMVTGVNADTFLVDSVRIQSNDDVGNDDIYVRVHVIESDEYKPAQFVILENPTYRLLVSNTGNQANQEVDAGFFIKGDPNEPNLLYDGSPVIGFISPDDDTLVGRYIFNERYIVPATDLSVDTCAELKTIVTYREFWPVRIQNPPQDQYWPWWRVKMKEYIFYSDDSSAGNPIVENKNEQYLVLKYLELFQDEPPEWWVEVPAPDSLPEAYLGMALDIDAPSDSGSVNNAGYDPDRRMAFIKGYGGVNENYKMAIGQRDTCYEFAPDTFKCWPAPFTLDDLDKWGIHILRNDSTVYPQGGYVDTELYEWMRTPGYSIQGDSSEADYNIVASGAKIPAHSYPSDQVWAVAYVEAISDRYEIEHLDTLVNMVMCGNVNRDNTVDISDVVYYVSYVLRGTGPCIWNYMGDVNGDGQLGIADIAYMISYLFRNGIPPQCSYLK